MAKKIGTIKIDCRGGTGQGSSLGSGQLIKILLHKQTNKLVKARVKILRLGLGPSLS